ncbi:MAG: DUF3011 domain-containing protein [Bdellovibrionales bacterium]|nr:DUF3011 domain-containing protein [Bdellovibrionales bacterium]
MKKITKLFIIMLATVSASIVFAEAPGQDETDRRGRPGYPGHPGQLKEFALEYRGQHFSGNSTLFLKQKLQQQYGNVAVNAYEVEGVRLVAKTQHGQGSAQLKVGQWMSQPKRIYGNPQDFNRDLPRNWDRVDFDNHSRGDDFGVWQMHLTGNFKVQRVVLKLREKNAGSRPGHSEIVQCGSSARRGSDSCRVSGDIIDVQLLRDFSRRNVCVKNRTWGFDRFGIWTSNGCVGSFRVELSRRGRGRY